MTTVAKSKCVATGSRFWTTMIATKIARIEAAMSFKLRIKSKKGLSTRFILSETPACESGDCWSPRNIWINVELKHPNAIEFYLVIFDLARRAAGAEIPLLLKQGPKCVGLVLRPLQGELLSAFTVQLYKTEPDTSDPLRLIEKKPNGLFSSLSSPPSALVSFRRR